MKAQEDLVPSTVTGDLNAFNLGDWREKMANETFTVVGTTSLKITMRKMKVRVQEDLVLETMAHDLSALLILENSGLKMKLA